MNSNNYQGLDKSKSGGDSFDVNFKQIEQTSNMLSSIENKLTDFFKRNRDQETKIKETVNEFQQSTLKSNYASPKHDNENRSPYLLDKQYSSGERAQHLQHNIQKPSLSNRFISIVDVFDNDLHTKKDKSNEILEKYLPHHNQGSPASIRDVLTEDNRGTVDRESKHQDPRVSNFRPSNASSSRNESRGNIIIDRMNKMEDFYQNKIHILEERVTNAERESQQRLRENNALSHEINQMRTELDQSRDQVINESVRNSYRQETQLIKDLERKLYDTENALKEANRKAEKYAEKLDSLIVERDYHSSEAARYRSRCEHLEEDYRQLNLKFQDLLQLHRRTTEFNPYDQEKQISVFPNYQSSFFNSPPSNTKSREYNLTLGDSINAHQREFETLKNSSSKIRRHFLMEMDRLKNKEKIQREDNIGTSQRFKATPTHRTSRTRRENEEPEFSRIIPTELYLTRDEDLSRMKKQELENYTRNLQASYVKLEQSVRDYAGKSREGIEQFNRAYELIYGDIEKRNTSRITPIAVPDSQDRELLHASTTSIRKKAKLIEDTVTPPRRELKIQQSEQNPEVLPKSSRKKSTGVSFEKSKSRDRKSSKNDNSHQNIGEELEKLKKIVHAKFGEGNKKKKTPKKSKKNSSLIVNRAETSRIPINLSELRSGRSKSKSKSRSKSLKKRRNKKSLSAKKHSDKPKL